MYGSCSTILRAIGLLLFATSGALTLASVGLSLNSIYFKLFATKTTGIIKQIKETSDYDGTYYSPVFSFIARDGIEYEFTTVGSSSNLPGEVGGAIKVLYFEGNPRAAKYDNYVYLFAFPLFLGMFAVISLVIGYFFHGIGGEMLKSG